MDADIRGGYTISRGLGWKTRKIVMVQVFSHAAAMLRPDAKAARMVAGSMDRVGIRHQ